MLFLHKICTKLSCKKIGVDEFGNEYFLNKNGRRVVVYKGVAEPSKIPAEWHGWMHYTTNVVPVQNNVNKSSWQKIHLPNLTGTKNAYSFKNTSLKKFNSVHEFWSPKNS